MDVSGACLTERSRGERYVYVTGAFLDKLCSIQRGKVPRISV